MPPKKPAEQAGKNNERNEYIPSFIAKKPFYIDDATASQDDYLEHQRLQSEKSKDSLATSQWYDRGKRAGPAATKFRKGACENCGAMTHKRKDCLSRPRKAGAKYTGKNIEADEVIQDVQLGFDAKRDRWNGYDASNFVEVIEISNRAGKHDDLVRFLQMARKTLREPKIDTELAYAYAKTDRLHDMEDFLGMTNVADILEVGEKCFEDELYQAAKLLFTSISNWARLATTLIYLGENQGAVESARKAGNTQ